MGLFGKKPTIFDEQQDKQLQALVKNQSVLIQNNNHFISDERNQWSWIQKLENDNKDLSKRLATLEAAIVAMQKIDQDFKEKLSGLATITTEPVESAQTEK